MTKIESHHLANTTIIIIASKKHRWKLKLVDKIKVRNIKVRNDIYIISRNFPHKMLTIYKERINNLTVEKLWVLPQPRDQN